MPQEDYAKLCAVTIDMMDALTADLDEIRGGASKSDCLAWLLEVDWTSISLNAFAGSATGGVFVAACKGVGMAQCVTLLGLYWQDFTPLDLTVMLQVSC